MKINITPKEFYKERGYEVLHSPCGPEAEDMAIKMILEAFMPNLKKTEQDSRKSINGLYKLRP